jgi:hypothetical protein
MKTNRLLELPIGFQESIIERSNIKSAISNCNSFIKYSKTCEKYYKESGEEYWITIGQNSLMPYYKKLLTVEFLANKYNYLWSEKFYKTKLLAEKILNI